ncbi:hypothetical protein ElyMa_002641600 [Elysia marginata]|uniref:Uncharacterized protein n=1 Tax=Elysia marginata TaxID=1093978 RepID=A0AAV4H8L5_9GAST|nr:hypothetical protein ElyMa_002641600 [Elysia marginata]
MPNIPEGDRRWLFDVIVFVMNTVRNESQDNYGDVTDAASEVEANLPIKRDLEKLKASLAALLFPERYKSPHHDPEFVQESEMYAEDGADPILDDPQLADLATLVDLKKDFGENLFF